MYITCFSDAEVHVWTGGCDCVHWWQCHISLQCDGSPSTGHLRMVSVYFRL